MCTSSLDPHTLNLPYYRSLFSEGIPFFILSTTGALFVVCRLFNNYGKKAEFRPGQAKALNYDNELTSIFSFTAHTKYIYCEYTLYTKLKCVHILNY